MNVKRIVSELKKKYPGKKILQNGDPVSEILCEVESTNKHKEYSLAVAVIDRSLPHFHKEI